VPQPLSPTLRPYVAQDEAFLQEVYVSTRADEMALFGWSEAQQKTFLGMQYQAQRRSYLAQVPAAEYSIIQVDHVAAGRLIVDRSGDVILLMDISLLPAYRGAGIGTSLMHDLLAEAARAGKPVRLHVEQSNRARHLYERLGFAQTADGEIYDEMTWRPRAELAESGS
jgi:ribosomal protein S18 acetylase RimI-like enzyme